MHQVAAEKRGWGSKTTRRLVLVLRPSLNQSPLRFAAPYAGVKL